MLVVQLISGFTQTEENWNGVQELREQLLSELDDYSTLSVRVRLGEWNSDWKSIARQLYMLRERYPREPFAVVVFAYSWGVGNGLVRFAKHLDRYGIDIAHAVLSDGVYRHWFSLGNWRLLAGKPAIALPANVLSWEGFYQETSWPMGQKPQSPVEPLQWKKLRLPHVEMDDARPWRQRCVEVAKQQAAIAVGSPSNVPVTAPASDALAAMERTTNVIG